MLFVGVSMLKLKLFNRSSNIIHLIMVMMITLTLPPLAFSKDPVLTEKEIKGLLSLLKQDPVRFLNLPPIRGSDFKTSTPLQHPVHGEELLALKLQLRNKIISRSSKTGLEKTLID